MSELKQDTSDRHFRSLMTLNLLGWTVFFVLFNCYCVFWREYGVGIGFDLVDSLRWFFKEWGVWALLSPLFIYGLEHKFGEFSVWKSRFATVVVFIFLVFTARLLLNAGEYPAEVGATLVHLFPKYSSGLIIFMGIWFFARKEQSVKGGVVQTQLDTQQQSILVEHNGLNTRIPYSDIVSVKTAGNYLEIETNSQTYLHRTTLKSLLETLPQDQFKQVHRSHVINMHKLQKLTNLDNGGGMAILSNQQTVPVSKRHKSQLKSLVVSSV
jgi:hypothetical protein